MRNVYDIWSPESLYFVHIPLLTAGESVEENANVVAGLSRPRVSVC